MHINLRTLQHQDMPASLVTPYRHHMRELFSGKSGVYISYLEPGGEFNLFFYSGVC